VSALKPVRICVRDEHIADGLPKHCEDCAVALAAREPITEIFPGATEVEVGGYVLTFRTADDDLMRASLPAWAVDFIAAFDRGEDVRPITFTITPAEVPVEEAVAA
jgi:hypothetical protein